MPIQTAARAKSLAFTAVGTGATGPILTIQSYTFGRSRELAEFLLGTSRVASHYQSTETATITVETSDLAIWADFVIGQKYSNVRLTIEGAIDSGNAAVGSDVTVTLSKAVITEVGEISMGNENSAPVVGSVTFALSRHAADTVDPTVVVE